MDKFYDDKIEDFEKRIDQTTDRIYAMLGDKEARARLNLDLETDLEKSFKKCIENLDKFDIDISKNLDKFDVDISKSLGMVNLSL